jgi:hypothetical protein
VTPTWRRYQEVQVFDFPARKTVDWDAVLTLIENGQVDDLPASSGAIERKAQVDAAFGQRLTAAKKIGAQVMIAEIIKIADCAVTRPEHKKLKIDARKYLAALWNAELNPKTQIEQTTTVCNLTPREEYIQQLVDLMGMSPQEAAARYQLETGGATVQ